MGAVRSSSLSEIARLGFESLSETIPKLDELVSLTGDAGRAVLSSISGAASPDRCLDYLIQLARADQKRISKLISKPKQAERICRVLGASEGLGDFFLRHPQQLDFVLQESCLPKPDELTRISALSVTQLRVEYRALLVKIADFDLSSNNLQNLSEVTAALSDLATAALEAGLVLARAQLLEQGKYTAEEIAETSIAVIAMGKCGARELNYLSDVDVIYVAEGRSENYLEIATRLATLLAKNLDEPDVEPGLWQVDPNLRPEGKQGALVRSLEAHASYYQRWAEPWEFQALLKARFVAGDKLLGSRYIDTIKPMIWSSLDRSAIVESARHLRKRVLDLIPADERDREIKLGRGGLRDVEFTAQLMQLVHGTHDDSLRVMDTLSALRALCDAGLLSRSDRDTFISNYQFLRALEHRTQLLRLRRTHLLPSDDSDLRRIARSMGLKREELLERWNTVRASTATLHDSVFYRPLLQATAALGDEVRLSAEEVIDRLRALGFKDPAGAAVHISALTQGVSRRSTIQRTLLPVLIRWMADGVDPDRALLSFRRLSEELGESHWFLRMLRDSSGAAERLMQALSNSALVSRLLEYTPESSEWFGDEAALLPLSAEEIESEMTAVISRSGVAAVEAVRNIRRREYLRVAIGAVLGVSSLREISVGLTAITDSYLRSMLSLAKIQTGLDADICIVAMGRLGGCELGFGSDADAMLVYGDSDPASAEKIASALLVLVSDSILHFELDLDLRPEGRNGARIRSLGGYKGYYEKWAESWEFQALLKARPISGSEELRLAFVELIDAYRYPAELSRESMMEIRRIKARVEGERLPQGADPARHLKLGRGSLSDVEWLTQLLQLQNAGRNQALQTTSTLDALESLKQLELVAQDDYSKLHAAWLLASRCRSGLVLAIDKLTDILPVDRRELEATARILEFAPGQSAQLEEQYLQTSRRARAVFERLFFA